jgi:hypothetical protein
LLWLGRVEGRGWRPRGFSGEELERLRGFPEIGREELIRFFTLTPADVEFIDPGRDRGPDDRLGLVILSPQVSIHDVHDLG